MADAKTLSLKEFKKSYDTFYTPLCLFANKYLNNVSAAEDVVQETFIKIWEKQVQFPNELALKSFLYTTVKNRSLDLLKTNYVKMTQTLTGDVDNVEDDSFFVKEVILSVAAQTIEEAVNSLPPKCREIINLSVAGLSNPEIAQELELSLNTIKAQKKIAYKKLKPLLKDYFYLVSFVF